MCLEVTENVKLALIKVHKHFLLVEKYKYYDCDCFLIYNLFFSLKNYYQLIKFNDFLPANCYSLNTKN